MANIDGAVLEENNRGGTRAGQVVDSIDVGIEEPLDASVVLNATEYFQELDNLEHETARLCNIHKVIASSSDISLTDCLIILWGCRDALHNLECAEFCSTYFNIFVEDPERNVANSVTISIFEIDNLIAALQFQTGDHRDAHRFILRLSSKLQLNEENQLVAICKALAIGLISFSVSHSRRFDIDIFDEAIGTFMVGPGRSLSLRNLACFQDFIRGQIWVLGKNQSPQELKVSISVEEFALIWGPVWSVGSVVEAVGGYIVAVAPSHTCVQGEIECHWQKHITQIDTVPRFSLTSRMLIGSGTPMFDMNQSCVMDIETHQQKIAQELRLPGTSVSHYASDTYAFSVGGGKHVTGTIGKHLC